MSPSKTAFEKYKPGGLFSEFYGISLEIFLMYCSLSAYGRLFLTLRTPNTCPCPFARGVRLRGVKNVVFERRNRWERSLLSANGKCPLTRGVRSWKFDCSCDSTLLLISTFTKHRKKNLSIRSDMQSAECTN